MRAIAVTGAHRSQALPEVPTLAEAGAPDQQSEIILGLLAGLAGVDDIVPWEENTGLIAERYEKLGGKIELIRKPGVGHHPHGLEDSTPIVDFIRKHTESKPSGPAQQ